jgi:hypothetical protein
MTVQQTIAAIMAELPSIGKADRSPEGYQYRGIEAITSRLQPLMAKHGLVIVPRATITSIVPSLAMREGWQDIHMQVEWSIVAADGSTMTATTCGVGRDRADKGANKAHTQALKYLLLSLFMVADRADDSEAHDVRADIDPAQLPAAGRSKRATTKRQQESHDEQSPIGTTATQLADIAAQFTRLDIDRAERLAVVRDLVQRDVAGASDLTYTEADHIISELRKRDSNNG